MKKLVLIPSTDTITICLPHDWVGKTIVCTMHNAEENHSITYASKKQPNLNIAAEEPAVYKSKKKSKKG
ncbi:MAG: hypothetical protein MJZ72_08775 [Bacteroidales bacterium]|nr:hypothetical protein [Bacteroidales bacterium]